MSKIKVFSPCEEVCQICDKVQYKEATLWDKLKLNLHVVYCKTCRNHTKTNSKLTKFIKKSKVKCLDHDCKEAMRQTIDKALKEQQQQQP